MGGGWGGLWCTPLFGLFGDVPLEGVWSFVLSLLNRVYNFVRLCPNYKHCIGYTIKICLYSKCTKVMTIT